MEFTPIPEEDLHKSAMELDPVVLYCQVSTEDATTVWYGNVYDSTAACIFILNLTPNNYMETADHLKCILLSPSISDNVGRYQNQNCSVTSKCQSGNVIDSYSLSENKLYYNGL